MIESQLVTDIREKDQDLALKTVVTVALPSEKIALRSLYDERKQNRASMADAKAPVISPISHSAHNKELLQIKRQQAMQAKADRQAKAELAFRAAGGVAKAPAANPKQHTYAAALAPAAPQQLAIPKQQQSAPTAMQQ